jgi:hypothetical protein
MVSEDQSETTFNVNVVAATTYYWKIIVKDDKGGQANGQKWSFFTNGLLLEGLIKKIYNQVLESRSDRKISFNRETNKVVLATEM